MKSMAWWSVCGLFAATLAVGCANNSRPECEGSPPVPTYQCCDRSSGPAWIDVFNDPQNCGRCGNVCPSGRCSAGACSVGPTGDAGMPVDGTVPTGMCTPSCSSTQRCCGTSCISRTGVAVGTNGTTDPTFMNCTGCGIACDPDRASACSMSPGASAPSCMCGQYGQCGAGQVCENVGGTYSCVNLSTDVNNCGMVGRMCATGESCVAGNCQCGSTGTACAAGQGCCGGACVDVTSDAMNCGMCGMACATGESCQAGMCVCGSGPSARRCTAPMAGMFGAPGMPGESCCDGACVANTDSNCGCGVACDTAMDETCQVGGDLFGMGGGMAQVCCGDESVAFFGCGGGGFPGADGGLPFP